MNASGIDELPDGTTRRNRRRVWWGAGIATLSAVVVVGLVVGFQPSDASGVGGSSSTTTDVTSEVPTVTRLNRIIDRIADKYDVTLGVSLRDDGEVVHAGELQEIRSWSTTKVPVAIAAVRKATDNDTLDLISDDLEWALTMSDNDAAMRLWYTLGSWQQGSAAITEVMEETGDPTDAVAAESASDYTGFGDIHWTLDNQVTFANRMSCLDGAEPVLDEMGQVVPVHRMGLGALAGARFKGGWGPEDDGTYLLREFGLVGEENRQVPIAIAVVPDDGSDTTAREALEAFALALEPVIDDVADHGGAAECQVPAGVPDASDAAPVSVAEYTGAVR
ncbi:serine hydrolase [Corynebacterium terpenotabidum]|uniref:Uncharacterized protein n=1 Tax=Corynebacterium terpenotabidum Y-11 TaxID=1200352 RepID=S4XME4_9CORY|nr:hypothetical protein [Corynebacterium terpenotabidum]AGP31808.1 hypothetical protein A606_10845 [Corynebacterium terpenotabidum Y-11]